MESLNETPAISAMEDSAIEMDFSCSSPDDDLSAESETAERDTPKPSTEYVSPYKANKSESATPNTMTAFASAYAAMGEMTFQARSYQQFAGLQMHMGGNFSRAVVGMSSLSD
jgi:hypothetical protein